MGRLHPGETYSRRKGCIWGGELDGGSARKKKTLPKFQDGGVVLL